MAKKLLFFLMVATILIPVFTACWYSFSRHQAIVWNKNVEENQKIGNCRIPKLECAYKIVPPPLRYILNWKTGQQDVLITTEGVYPLKTLDSATSSIVPAE